MHTKFPPKIASWHSVGAEITAIAVYTVRYAGDLILKKLCVLHYYITMKIYGGAMVHM